MVSVLGRGEREGDEAGVAIHPLVSAIAQMAVGQCWGKYLVPIPSTWKSSDVSSWLHYILDQASGWSCITTLVCYAGSQRRGAASHCQQFCFPNSLQGWPYITADAYVLNSCNFMLNFIIDATFLMKIFIFTLYPHTAPDKQLMQTARIGN